MKSGEEDSREQAKEELRGALDYFIGRQKLVAQAMTEMGLDLNEVAEYKGLAWGAGLSSDESGKAVKSTENYDEYAESENPLARKLYQVAKRTSERNLPQHGIWHDHEQNEWKYFLHGGGCRLVNYKTGEPIDWDCPDVNSYDKYKFLCHFEWQLSSPECARKFTSIRKLDKGEIKSLLAEID